MNNRNKDFVSVIKMGEKSVGGLDMRRWVQKAFSIIFKNTHFATVLDRIWTAFYRGQLTDGS